jgi:predicted unusual protein kinase regulating ubiquinone biosynthesis (AarF/ABC1/UbiB family)
VLTTDLVDGRRFQAFCDDSTQEQRNQAGAVISKFAFKSIFKYHAFNCDPHPGNYLFTRDGRVAFLDFGCVKAFEPEFVERWKRMIRSVLEQNHAAFKEAILALQLVPNPSKFDFEYHFKVMLYLYRPWLRDKPFRYTREYAAESTKVLVTENPNQFQTNIPRDFVFVNRLQWGLNSVLARLSAEANWRQSFLPLIYEPGQPTPPPFPADAVGADSGPVAQAAATA